jgi:putative flippase GtrA
VSTLRELAAHHEVRRIFKFGVTGVLGFTADFGTLVLTHTGLGLPLRLSLIIAYTVGGIVHYGLTRFWVFPATDDSSEAGRVVRYLLLAAVNTAATLLIVPALSSAGLDYRLAKIICVVVLFGFNYVITPRFVMRGAPRQQPPPAV